MNITNDRSVSGVLIDEVTLTIVELANACSVDYGWVVQRVEDGLLERNDDAVTATVSRANAAEWRFASTALIRARRLANIERTFDANAEVAALVVDLLEEVATLRQQRF
jgi:chaperone modulatory protein CbpM